MKQQHRWERDGGSWYLVPIRGGDPVAAITPSDRESGLLRHRAQISFRGHCRRHDWDNAREARRWVEQTLADWIEWKDCEIKKRFRFTVTERQRLIATTIIVGGGLATLVVLGIFDVARSAFEDAWTAARPAAVATAPKAAARTGDCRPLVRAYRVAGWISESAPIGVWWGQQTHVLWVYDDRRQP